MGGNRNPIDWQGVPTPYEVGGYRGYLPLRHHDSPSFAAMYPADHDAVAAALPSEALEPLRWIDGRALILVVAYRWERITWSGPDGPSGQLDPYGEVGVAAMASVGPAPRVLLLMRGQQTAAILQLPVTTREARDGGRTIYGKPKFLADMDFTEAPTARGVRVSDEGVGILSLTVDLSGRWRPRSVPTVGHVSLDGQLREVVTPSCGYEQFRFGSSGAELTLGTHPVAKQIRELGLAARPVAVMNRLRASILLLPPGDSIGPARAIPCFAGRDDDRAGYTISYIHSDGRTRITVTPTAVPRACSRPRRTTTCSPPMSVSSRAAISPGGGAGSSYTTSKS